MNAFQRVMGGLMAMFAKGPSIEQLQEKLQNLSAQAQAIQDQADADQRELTAEETAQIQAMFEAFDKTEKEIKRREQVEAMQARLNAAGPRVTEDPTPRGGPQAAVEQPLRGHGIEGGDRPGASKGTNGFVSLGEYALSVKAAVGGQGMDPRLRPLAATPSTQSQEAQGADGGYMVPPDFRVNIMNKVMGEDSLLGRCDQQTTTSNSLSMPVDDTTPWQTSGGVQVYWEGEGGLYGQSKVSLKDVSVRANKMTALCPVSDELLEDAPSLTAYLNRKVGDKMTYKLNDAIINGDGVMKPLGILKSPALVSVAKEGSQAADTIVVQNIEKMWSRMYAPLRRTAVWVINQDIEPQLGTLTLGGTSVAIPVYLPPNGLAGAPNGTLKGRPIVYSEACATLGDQGDINLVDFSQYMALVKTGGVRSDVSIHLWFDYGLTAFRFTMRVGGRPWWPTAIARAKGSNTLSFAVTLDARA